MTDKKKLPPTDEDPEESKRFLDLARELEADGDLSPTDAAERFDALTRRVLKPAPKKTD